MFDIETRRCRFVDEVTSHRSYPLGVYTQSLCLTECAADAAVKLCGCRPFFYKIGLGPICNVTGMFCLLKNHWNDYRKNCSCLPHCNAVHFSFARINMRYANTVIVLNSKIKKIRNVRDLKFGLHFLVVSIGGAAALFLGCSFISFAEIIYFTTIHLYETHLKRRK
ncbi:pickpocket protein 11-like [Contarinia nasturtii]|uniref:pickpocket protein 11-like n=1 Tax=Contarinia nasturtii TaxID=265458 RepID=UPI0012D3A1F7|nr:pickpocket protein 11-like [Contarinia nasturtii]XP_031637593.1 pickpocket protein 11-like [Contarinia nasturtii]